MTEHPIPRLSAFLDGELDPAARAEVEAHLRECGECARHLAELAGVDALARELKVEVPAGYFEALPGRVRARVRARRRALIRPGFAAGLAAVAAVVLVMVTVPVLITPRMERARTVADEAMPAAPAATMAASPALDQAVTVGRAPGLTPPTMAAAPQLRPTPAGPPRALGGYGSSERRQKAADAAPGFVGESREPGPQARAENRAKERDEVARLEAHAEPDEEVERQRRDQGRIAGFAGAPSRQAADSAAAAPPPAAAAPPPAATAAAPAEGAIAGQRRASPALRKLADADRFAELEGTSPGSVAEARALRQAWDAYATQRPDDPRSDEARVRAIEASLAAWRLGGDENDLAQARIRADAYLIRGDARQRDRVRALIARMEASPPR